MEKKELTIEFFEIESEKDLSINEQRLIQKAKDITGNSYAPYSNFHVGAAVLTQNGEIIQGTNQENAAYPSGLCAERVALFYANSNFPGQSIEAIAVTAANVKGFIENPIAPCGSCRQVMLETEQRFNLEMKIFLVGKNKIYLFKGVKSLLPYYFDKSDLYL